MTMPLPAPAAGNRARESWIAEALPRAFAIFFVLHGLVHIVGFTNPWRLGAPRGVDYTTWILNHSIDVGDAGVKALGFVWLAATAAFVVVGVMLWQGHRRARTATIVMLAGSLALCAIGLPNAVMGLALDLVLLALVAVAPERLIVRRDGIRTR